MSQDITATLLPSSRVDFFVLDAGTADTARTLAADWRFARVGIQVYGASIESAIATYAQQKSPEVIIIETDDISENFIAQLGQLAAVCAEGTDAVIVGPMNDVHLYRSLVGMGVRDYLVRPVAPDDLVKVIAKALVDKRGLAGARLVSVIGAKGGAGTTAIAQALAWLCADTLKQKTLLMDGAGSAGSIGIGFGMEPMAPLAEAVRIGNSGSEDDLKRILQTCTEQLSLLVCGGEAILTESPDTDSFEGLVNRLMQKYPVVIVDLSGAEAAVQKRIIARSSRVVLVTTPLLTSLRNCRTLLNEIRNARGGAKDIDLILNMQGMAPGDEMSAKDIKTALDLDATAKIPYMPKIFAGAEASGKPIAQNKASADIIRQLQPIAEAAAGAAAKEPVETKKDSGGSFGFLKSLGKKSK